MKTNKTILNKINSNKEILKAIESVNHYEIDNFIKDGKDYIKAIKSRRMMCVIKSVSASGMSRVLSFNSCEKGKNQFWYRQYYALFTAMGYKEKNGGFTVGGCGMDMIFHTNYTIIHKLYNLGFISKSECSSLAQMTPSYF